MTLPGNLGQTRHPMIDLVYNDETGRYIAHLEQKLLKLTLDSLKAFALLELLTGDNYADYNFGAVDNTEELKRIARDALERRLGLSPADAAALVQERWEANNADVVAADASYLIGPRPTQAKRMTAPTSRAVETETTGPGYDVAKHLAGLERAAKNRDAHRNSV